MNMPVEIITINYEAQYFFEQQKEKNFLNQNERYIYRLWCKKYLYKYKFCLRKLLSII